MVSAAEQMAANTSWAALGKATDLRNRILFTLGLLIVYRLGTFIPVPGIDGTALREFMEQAGQGIGGMVSMFTGGALGAWAFLHWASCPISRPRLLFSSDLDGAGIGAIEERGRAGPQENQPIHTLRHSGFGDAAGLWACGQLEAGGLVTEGGLFFRAVLSCHAGWRHDVLDVAR